MINIDIILPSFKKSQKYQKFQKYQLYPFPSLIGNWYPVWYNKNYLKKMGAKVNFVNFFNVNLSKLNEIVCFDSRIISNLVTNYGSVFNTTKKVIIPFLKKIRKKSKQIIYFDNGDSSGYTQFELLPFVDYYYKKQMLKDKTLYSGFLFKKRLFTDFYVRNYGLKNEGTKLALHPLEPEYEKKTGISWNFALRDYRHSNKYNRILYGFSKVPRLKYYNPNKNRKFLFSANYSIKTGSMNIDFQRIELMKLLEKRYNDYNNVSLGRISKRKYLETQRNSKVIFSPFGWGEVCYRDFEVFIAGAALVKPNMNHLETWPDLYKENKTYIPISWKIEEWESEIPKILNNDNLLLRVAKNGQKSYMEYWSKKGRKLFSERFLNMIVRSERNN